MKKVTEEKVNNRFTILSKRDGKELYDAVDMAFMADEIDQRTNVNCPPEVSEYKLKEAQKYHKLALDIISEHIESDEEEIEHTKEKMKKQREEWEKVLNKPTNSRKHSTIIIIGWLIMGLISFLELLKHITK